VTLVPAALKPTATPVMLPWIPPFAAFLLQIKVTTCRFQQLNFSFTLQINVYASKLLHYPFHAGTVSTYDLSDAERDSDGGVCEGHDGGEGGEPPHAVQAGDLREGDLHDAVDGNVRADGAFALALVPFIVVATRPLDRARNAKQYENRKDLLAETKQRR
jgi:hypothetical protein